MSTNRRAWLARALILPVLAWNLQCATTFLAWPERYVAGFALEGVPGASMVRALGLLFVMWNVPYAIALWRPIVRRVSLFEALAMQVIGVIGESLLLASLPAGYLALRDTTWRFIAFDGAGVALLTLAVWVAVRTATSPTIDNP